MAVGGADRRARSAGGGTAAHEAGSAHACVGDEAGSGALRSSAMSRHYRLGARSRRWLSVLAIAFAVPGRAAESAVLLDPFHVKADQVEEFGFTAHDLAFTARRKPTGNAIVGI